MVKLPAPDIFPDAVKQKSLTDIKVPCPCILVPRSKGASIKGWTTQEQTRLCVEGLPSYNLYYWNALTSQFSKAVFVCYGVFELSSGIGTKIVSRQGSTFVVHYLVIRPTEFDLRFVCIVCIMLPVLVARNLYIVQFSGKIPIYPN